jgi:hypothetical protein
VGRLDSDARTVDELITSAGRSLESLCLALERNDIDFRRWQTRVFAMTAHCHLAAAALALGVEDPGPGGILPDLDAQRRQIQREFILSKTIAALSWAIEHSGLPPAGWIEGFTAEVLNLQATYNEELPRCPQPQRS